MNQNNYLAQNLRIYKAIQQVSLRKLAKQLNIPKSTLRSIMKDGNTTLDTALRISENLNISMDMLFQDRNLPHKLMAMYQFQRATLWLDSFTPEKRKELCLLFSKLWAAMAGK